MATARYEVEYSDGRKRVKLLHAEDAKDLREQKGVKSVTKAREPSSNKSRSAEGDK